MADPPTETLRLAADFQTPNYEDWRKLVDGVLKGRPFESLISRTQDGIAIDPIYERASHGRPIAARAPGALWQIMQRADHPDPAAANAEALHDLENGATGLSLVFAGAAGEYGFGLPPTADAVARVLEGVHLDAGISLELDLPAEASEVDDALAAYLKGRGILPSATDIRFGFDPLGAAARTGAGIHSWSDGAPGFAEREGRLAALGFKGPFAAADGRPIHAAGGSEAQELAFVLVVVVAYLRALEASGIALDEARRMIIFRLAADADQFLTIAKLRAARRLWGRVEEACGLAPRPAFIAAETAWRMMTRCDAHVNMLRVTIAAFAAAVGGANAITVLPFTAALGLPDRFARRISRNTQLILAEESHLAKVADPSAGSGAIEALTDELCRLAWTLFQEIEAAGGAAAALEANLIQAKVAAVRAARERAVAKRADALTGVSEFPNLAELPVAVLEQSPPPSPLKKEEHAIESLRRMRLAEPFEALRDASDRMLAETGARPKIFLANLGRPADFLPRATFAKNFFEAGGIEAMTNDGFASVTEMASAFRASDAQLACLCSSDAVYEREAVAAAKALAAAGARHIYLAGRMPDAEAMLRAAGVQSFIYAGCDALRTLQDAYDTLGR